jgi:hypothetical protein
MWYATSPDVKGLLVAAYTLGGCLSEIVPGAAALIVAAPAWGQRRAQF